MAGFSNLFDVINIACVPISVVKCEYVGVVPPVNLPAAFSPVNPSLFLEKGVDVPLVDGLVRGIGKLTQSLASITRKIQTGNTGYYAIVFVFAILLLFIFFI